MTSRSYASPEAFKQALEQRLRSAATSGPHFARQRQLLVFDRFLARLVAVVGETATLKGGLVLELRLERARTTRDIDLRITGTPDEILGKLQEAGRLDLGDFLSFEVRPDAEHPEIQNEGMRYGSLRKPADALCLDCHGPSSPNGPRAPTLAAHTHHEVGSAGSQWVSCHMPKIAQTIGDVNVRSHTFRFVTPAESASLKIPNACNLCHADRSTAWATDALRGWAERSPWRVSQ